MAKKRKSPARTLATTMSEVARKSGAVPESLLSMAQQLRSWTDSVLGAGSATAAARTAVTTAATAAAARVIAPRPEQRAALAKAGSALRDLRETAGLSVEDVRKAADVKDRSLLDAVESGKATLPFDVILRLAGVLGRNDPLPFVMRFARTYNPDVWRTLENLGIGRLAVQAGREREMANLYRGSDAARALSDDDFADVLAFTKAAFDMAVEFAARTRPRSARPKRKAGATG